MADISKPISFCEHLDLSSVGVLPASISFRHMLDLYRPQTLTLESDRFICARERVNGQSQVVIIDLADANSVLRRPISADSAIMHPSEKILAIQAGRTLQIFNLETQQELKSHTNHEDVVFWKWVSENTIGIVTETSVSHWSLADQASCPQKVFDRHATLAGVQMINYRETLDGKWLVLIGISSNSTNPSAFKVKGAMQLYSRDRGISQPIEGHAAAFAELKLDGHQNVTKLFTFAVRTATGAKLHVVQMDHTAPDPPFVKKAVDVYFPPEATYDFPVSMQVSSKHGIVFLVTKYGFVHLYDLESGACVYMNRISGETIFVTAEHKATHGIIGVNGKGQLLSVSVDEKTIIPYILTTLNDIDLALKLASRANLPGADDLYTKQYQQLFSAGQYSKAAKVAANSPRGILRTPQVIESLKPVPTPPSGISPIIEYFGILLEKGELDKFESLELARPLIQQGRKQLFEKWMKMDKFTCSEELGDFVRLHDTALALSVYLKANIPKKVIACFADTGQMDKIVPYSKRVGYSPDYTALLQQVMRTNPDKGAEFATLLINDETGPLIDVERVLGRSLEDLHIKAHRGPHEPSHTEDSPQEAIDTPQKMKDSLQSKSQQAKDSATLEHECKKLQTRGDSALQSKQYEVAIEHYSSALSLNLTNATVGTLLTKRSKARAMKGLWESALEDANKAIELDPSSPWGYERKHAALHGAGKYSDAVGVHETMLSVIGQSPDPQIRELSEKYIHPSRVKAEIRSTLNPTIRSLPRILIDTASGRLCDANALAASFETSETCSQLISSMRTLIDHSRIREAIAEYYRYVMLSHTWEMNEPLLQMVDGISIYTLKASPTHIKLQRFCTLARKLGFRLAWSDTCCIDRKDLVVLQESLVLMFKWYRGSALTIVYLRGVDRDSGPGGIMDSLWNSRGWTYQEYVAAEVVQFYTEDWMPYLNMPTLHQDQRIVNHKASQGIIREMQQAIRRDVGGNNWPELQPGLDHIREKLCLASTRQTTHIEDAAYSLFGILSTSIPVIYGEGENALGRFLAQVLMSSRDVSILAWTGESSTYNSCLPSRIIVFKELAIPYLPSHLDPVSMEQIVASLRTSFPDPTEAIRLYNRISDLQRPWFAGQCMHLPCITFQLRLDRTTVVDRVHIYQARSVALGAVEIKTTGAISRPHSLFLIHPWISTLLDLASADEGRSSPEEDITTENDAETMATCAFRLVARLQQPFCALLVERSRNGMEYRRVATDAKITVQVQRDTSFTHLLENVRTLEVL